MNEADIMDGNSDFWQCAYYSWENVSRFFFIADAICESMRWRVGLSDWIKL